MACISQTANFDVLVLGIDVDMDKLARECLPQNCLKKDDVIVIRSVYDSRVAIHIFEDQILWQLPYKKDLWGGLVANGMKPEQFNPREAARKDVDVLKAKGYIRTSDKDVEQILSMVQERFQRVMFCDDKILTGPVNSGCGGVLKGLDPTDGVSSADQGVVVSQRGGCGQKAGVFELPAQGLK